MLKAYRDTPHPVTGVPPYQAMTNRLIRTKLECILPKQETNLQDKIINKRDECSVQCQDEREEDHETLIYPMWLCSVMTKESEFMVNAI